MKRCLSALALLAVSLPLTAAEPVDTAAVVRGNNVFAFDLYAQLRSKDGNLFFSPYSVSAALAMTSAGARGRTLDEMNQTLHFPSQEQLHPAFAELDRGLNGGADARRGYELRTANKLWGQKDFGFRPGLKDTLRRHYGAGLEEVDFAAATEDARRRINADVARETNDRIKDLLQPGILTGDTRFVLTNAVYFKGDWLSQFKKDRTREGQFRLADGRTVKTTFMHQSNPFPFAEEKTFSAVELPYVGKELSMVVLLPKKPDGLAELERGLSVDRLQAVLGRLKGEQVHLTLPKFKVTAEFRLDETLSRMGMPSAFDPTAADLSGFAEGRGLFIQAVVHKAFVEVSEEGTEAAAATAVVGGEESDESVTFRADHPF